MRIATYNTLEGGQAPFGAVRGRFDLIAEVAAAIAPDLLALQELVGWQNQGRALFKRFAAATGLDGELFVGDGFPIGLLVRPPWRIVAPRFLRSERWHGLAIARIEHPDGTSLRAIAAHLSPQGPRQRLAEVEAALAAFDDAVPAILFGDLNLISHLGGIDTASISLPTFIRHASAGALDQRVSRRLAAAGFVDAFARLNPGCHGYTIPTPAAADSPFSPARLDYILVSAPLAPCLREARIHRQEPADRASDHYPLLVDLEIGAGATGPV